MAGMVGLLAIVVFVGAANDAPETLTAKRFILVGDDGEIAGTWGTDRNSIVLHMGNPLDAPNAFLRVDRETKTASMNLEHGKSTGLSLFADPRGSAVTMHGSPQIVAVDAKRDTQPLLNFGRKNGLTLFTVADPSGSSFIVQATDKVAASTLRDAQGAVSWQETTSPAGAK